MLLAHPAVLTRLLEQYATLLALNAEEGSPEARRRMEDIAYTLCVTTGTRDIDSALVAARHQLPGARPEDDSVLGDTAQRVPDDAADGAGTGIVPASVATAAEPDALTRPETTPAA
ncbi:uncharacterized protein DUF5133 [Streptomyces sp. PsTaAH-137]|nr:DUF5133 domain-containing protein [Streptomyces sp. SID8367]MYT73833.1 DUF5133 domain-containing protein [Streptomyces sp. SID8367]RAJ89246.1 uncharacterized protein DUF5133 [Streptomyces sp. PsTaAH-137]